MAQNTPDLAQHVGSHLRSRAVAISRAWLAQSPDAQASEDQLTELINLTADLVSRMASVIAHEGTQRDTLQEDVQHFFRLRRGQGHGFPRMVRDFHALEEAILSEVDAAVSTFSGDTGSQELLTLLQRSRSTVRDLSGVALEIATSRLEQQAARRLNQLQTLSNTLDLEIRNRLNTVHLLIERYKADSLYVHKSSVMVDYLSRVQDRLESVKSVAEDLFAVEMAGYRLDANSRAHVLQALPAVMQGVRDDLQEEAQDRGIRITLSDGLPDILIEANPVRLILVNLLTNAIKHSNPGGEEPPPEVTVGAKYDQGEWEVFVADNGVGIAPADHDRIFRRYERGSTAEAGHGLGLFLAREAVTQLGGRIWVESEIGRGATFRFTLGELPD